MATVKKKSPKISSPVTDPTSLESTSSGVAPTPPPVVDDGGCQVISSSSINVTPDGVVKVETVPPYKSYQEAALRKVGIDSIAAMVAGITFEGDVPTPRASFQGGLYQPPGFKSNLVYEDRLIVTTTMLDAVAADAKGLACVALAAGSTGVPEGLVKLLGDRTLVLVRDGTKSPGNDALRALEKAFKAAMPTAPMVVVPCPSAESFKLKQGEDVTLGVWLKQRSAPVVSSAIAKKVRDHRDETSRAKVGGGFIPLGWSGAACTVFSLSRNKIIDLSPNDLKSWTALGGAIGGKFLRSNYLKVSAETQSQTIDTLSIGLDILARCDEIGDYQRDHVFGDGVWRNSEGKLVINSKICFHPDGTLAKRIDGDAIYVAGRDLCITPDTPSATVDEAKTVFSFYERYNYTKLGDALKLFGHVCHTYTAGANAWRSWCLLTGLPSGGKSTVMLYSQSLLGRACDAVLGGSEAGMRHNGGMSSLGWIWDEAEPEEGGESEFRKMMSNIRKGVKGGVEKRGSSGGSPVQHAIKSQAMVAANKFPDLKKSEVTRMFSVYLTKFTDKGLPPHALVPDPKAARFIAVEEMGRKLFMRMLRANDRYLLNLAQVELALAAESRASDTLAPSIAASFTALHDEVLNNETAAAWVRNFDFAEDLANIAEAQSSTGIIEHLSYMQVPSKCLAHGTLPCTMLDLWHVARQGEGTAKANAISSLAVMGMKVQPGPYRGSMEVRFFPKRAGLLELFKGTEWATEDLTKALLNDPRTDNALSTRTAELRVESARLKAQGAQTFTPVGGDEKRTTGERFVSLTLEAIDEHEEASLERAASIALYGDPVAEWKAANHDAENPGADVAPADEVSVIEKIPAVA